MTITEWTGAVTDSVTAFLGSLGAGANSFFTDAFVNTGGTGPNELGVVMLMFIGLTISLAVIRLIWRAVVR